MGGKCHCRNQNTGISSQSFSISYVYSGVIVMTAAYRITKFCIVVLALAPFFGFAETSLTKDDFYNLPLDKLGKVEITSATGNSTPLDRAPATATVITEYDIQAMGARTLDDVLEMVPGLHVSLSSLNRLDSVYSIRGIHTGFNPHVLLLVNGVPVQSSLFGSRPALLKFPVTSIYQIEVIRGPGSAIYGADAYSGVVNILTKDPSNFSGIELGARAGKFDYKEFWVQSAFSLAGWSILADFTYQDEDSDEHRIVENDLQSNIDSFFGTDASLSPTHLSTRREIFDSHITASHDQWKMNLWYWESNDAGIGAGAAQALDTEGHDDSRLYLADITYQIGEVVDGWDNSIRFSYFDYELKAQFNLFPAGSVIPIGEDGNIDFASPNGFVTFSDGLIGNPGVKTKDTQIEIVSIYKGWDSHRIRISVGGKDQKLKANEQKNFGPGVIDGSEGVVTDELVDVTGTENVFIRDSSRNVFYLSLQNEWRFSSDWELTAGLRYDEYSDFGGTINPRVALVWSASEILTWKFLYGSAFRAPSFSEQFYQNNPVSIGREDLDPETIDTLEVSANIEISKNLRTNINAYYYEAEDLIEFIPDGGVADVNIASNARSQRGKGFEWELLWRPIDSMRVVTSYSWNNTKDMALETNIADAPTKQFSAAVNWEVAENLYIYTGINWVGGRNRSVGDERGRVDDYQNMDFSIVKKNLFVSTDFSLSVKNVMNENIFEPSGVEIPGDYPLSGRVAWVEVKHSF